MTSKCERVTRLYPLFEYYVNIEYIKSTVKCICLSDKPKQNS